MGVSSAAVGNAELADQLLLAIPAVPLLGSALTYLLCNEQKKLHPLSGWVASAMSFISFLFVVRAYFALDGLIQSSGAADVALTAMAWTWFEVGGFTADFALRFDRLSSVMCLVITGVGTLIHVYAIGYMHEDEHQPRFFAYLNLFLFAMLLLVLGDNLLLMFVGWEGVGLCSYLLIGFWFKDMENAHAGQKAFVVNRIGDAGFVLGVFLLFVSTGTINFAGLEEALAHVPIGIKELAAILLFVGAMGKSAQIPLYVWLPDAMAGPTPVSALIHAATMVTAGVYMIARLSVLFVAAPTASLIIVCVGTATAFFAATIALVQNDIKKVLAYSTVSQLGYMFMAMGVQAYSNGIYHVVTHAFFKACLFMCAGSVIIGCHHEQDMREYGGLRKTMPWTFATYFVATLAIAGFPFLSGFFSKDAILAAIYFSEPLKEMSVYGGLPLSKFLWAIGTLTAFLTAFYMTRSLMMTFFGEYRGHAHPHESPWVVVVPLVILAVLSAGYGLVFGSGLIHFLGKWTRPDLLHAHDDAHAAAHHFLEFMAIVIALSGIGLAWFLYGVRPAITKQLATRMPMLHNLLENKWWVDELYAAVVVRPLRGLADLLFTAIDRAVVDGAVNFAGIFVVSNGEIASKAHVGKLSIYALLMFSGSLIAIVFWLVI